MLVVDGAEWPFLDGQMVMLPTRMQLGGAAVRRFEMRVSGVNAAKFITEMNIGNLAATGLFDGRIPLMFDQNGGHVAVSYTHLDVYKRQAQDRRGERGTCSPARDMAGQPLQHGIAGSPDGRAVEWPLASARH